MITDSKTNVIQMLAIGVDNRRSSQLAHTVTVPTDIIEESGSERRSRIVTTLDAANLRNRQGRCCLCW